MTDSSEFPCRTKVISVTIYRVMWYRVSNGELAISTTVDSQHDADIQLEIASRFSDKYTVKITPESWTENVCIECGKESLW